MAWAVIAMMGTCPPVCFSLARIEAVVSDRRLYRDLVRAADREGRRDLRHAWAVARRRLRLIERRTRAEARWARRSGLVAADAAPVVGAEDLAAFVSLVEVLGPDVLVWA